MTQTKLIDEVVDCIDRAAKGIGRGLMHWSPNGTTRALHEHNLAMYFGRELAACAYLPFVEAAFRRHKKRKRHGESIDLVAWRSRDKALVAAEAKILFTRKDRIDDVHDDRVRLLEYLRKFKHTKDYDARPPRTRIAVLLALPMSDRADALCDWWLQGGKPPVRARAKIWGTLEAELSTTTRHAFSLYPRGVRGVKGWADDRLLAAVWELPGKGS